jgi:adenylate cyclase
MGMANSEGTRRLQAILAADAAGYSRLMQQDDEGTVATLEACRAVFREKIQAHGGRVVDTAGDSVLAVFEAATAAVRAAVEIQASLTEQNAPFPESRRMRFRIGVNLGEVIKRPDGTVYGDGVNVAARLQSAGEVGGVTVSGTVFDQVEGKLPLSFKFAGEQSVKNIAKPVRAYHTLLEPSSPARITGRSRLLFSSRPMLITAGVLAIAGIVFSLNLARKPVTASSAVAVASDPVYAMPSGPSIAVLPFVNMSGDPRQEYFSDGLTEDIITELSRFRGLYVLARNTTYQYKGQAVDIPSVGSKLRVQYMLEGSVQKSANKFRITAQLIDTQNGVHIWAERYDRQLKDIFVVQEEISSKIAGAISGGFGGSIQRVAREAAFSKSPDQLRAYDYLLRGTMTNEWWNKEGYRNAKAQLQKSLELDPGYAAARQQYAWLMLMGWIFRLERTPAPPEEIKQNAIRAVELDPVDPLAHRTAAIGYYFDNQMEWFEREATDALNLAPNNPEILSVLGFLIASRGEWERGIKLALKAHDLNPISAGGWYHSVLYYDFYRRGMYAKALEVLKLHPVQGLIETQNKYTAVYAELGDLDKAREHWKKCIEIDPEWSAEKMYRLFHLWNFEESFVTRYMQSIAKAGYVFQK